MVKAIYRFKTDKISVADDFEPAPDWLWESARGLAHSGTLRAVREMYKMRGGPLPLFYLSFIIPL
jgi:hypothetical protein